MVYCSAVHNPVPIGSSSMVPCRGTWTNMNPEALCLHKHNAVKANVQLFV